MTPGIVVTQVFGTLIPWKRDRGKFNILTEELQYSICVKVLTQKMLPSVVVFR